MADPDAYLTANAEYVARYTGGAFSAAPVRHLAVVACMDARLDPVRALGLRDGDAHIIRNAGGRLADALRSLVISQQLLGTREIVIIHHTECGMLTFTDDHLRQRLRDELHANTDMPFHTFRDLEQSVRDDLAAARSSPLLLPDVPVRGFIFDVRTGAICEVR